MTAVPPSPSSLYRYTALARLVDPRLPSNRAVIAGVVIAALVSYLASGRLAGAMAFAATVFLSWAVGREIDPDNAVTSVLAMAGSVAMTALVGPSSVALSFAVLMGVRMTAGTVGIPLRVLDSAALVAVAAISSSRPAGLVAGGVLCAGALVAARSRAEGRVLAAIIAAVTIGGSALAGWDTIGSQPGISDWIVFGMVIVATPLVLPAPDVVSRTDATDEILSRSRLTRARIVAVLAVAGSFAVADGISATAGTVGAPIIAAAIARADARLRSGAQRRTTTAP